MNVGTAAKSKSPPRIVLDTNVLYAGFYSASAKSHQLLRAIASGQVRIALSTPLLFEYEDVLKRHHSALGLSDAQVDVVPDNLCAQAAFQSVYFLWRPCFPDAKDDMVLELAVAAQILHILTFNAKDFRPLVRFGIDAITPKTMLLELL